MPHSSGGGSHSGGSSSHSSSHSSGGSHSGGLYRPAPKIYSSYHPGTHRYVYYDHNRPHYYYSERRAEDNTPSRIHTLFFIIFWTIFSLPFWFEIINKPSKLVMDYNTAIVIEDKLDVLTGAEEVELEEAFREFQNETGITPALITDSNSAWQNYYNDIEQYAYDAYVNRFEDEKHWLLVYTTAQKNDFDDWYWHGMQGDDTDNILTSDATSRFNEEVQEYLTARSRNTIGDSFVKAFRNMSTDIMNISVEWPLVIFMFFFDGIAYVALIPQLFTSKSSKKQAKAIRCKSDTEPVLEDTCEYCGGVYVHGLHISCPHCGAPIKAMS